MCPLVPKSFKRNLRESLKKPLVTAMNSKNTVDIRHSLRNMKAEISSDVDILFDYLLFSSHFYNKMLVRKIEYDFSSRDYTSGDLESIEELLDLFEKHEEDSRFLGIFAHFTYIESWIDLIWSYLSHITYNDLHLHDDSPKSLPTNAVLRNHNDCTIWFHKIISSGNNRLIKLMKKHDRLLLELIPLHQNPANTDQIAIFNGTRDIIDRMLLNLSFPGKLEYFLSRYSDMPEFPGSSVSEIDACHSEALPFQRLLDEFPQYEHIVRIDYSLWKYNIRCGEGDGRMLIEELKPYYEILLSGRRLENYERYHRDINVRVLDALVRTHTREKEYTEAAAILQQCLELAWLKGEDWLKLYSLLAECCNCEEDFDASSLLKAVISTGEKYIEKNRLRQVFSPEITESILNILYTYKSLSKSGFMEV
ncbi:MAG: hypothetical protein AB9903_27940 [Vulcanimicrobiota bacterium]